MFRAVRLLSILAIFTAAPAAADAATPFTAGTGEEPSVAVGSDGVGHVAWVTDEDNARVGYCRVSPGGTACNSTDLLQFGVGTTDANGAGRATVYSPAPNKVVVVAGCWNCPTGVQDRVYAWTSTNNGDSFGPPVELGSGMGTEGFGAWIDVSESFVAASGSRVKAQDGGDVGNGVQYATGGIFVYGPEVIRVPGQPKLVAATNDLDAVRYGAYVSPGPHSITSINSPSSWLIDQTLPGAEPDNDESALNAGPNGVFLTYRSFVPNDSHIGLRKFDPAANSFGAPTYLEGQDPIDDNSLDAPDSFQDSSGRIHVVWRTLYDGGRLRYTVSDTSGGAFSTAATLARSESVTQPEVAAGPSGSGFVTWTPGATAGAVRVVPIDPQPESGATAGAPDTTRPDVSGFDIGDTILSPGQHTKFTFTASEPGVAVLTVEKQVKGIKGRRRGKKVCLPLTKKRLRALRRRAATPQKFRKSLRKRGCRAYRRIGEIRQQVKQGRNTIEFNGRIAGRKLKPGRYRATLVITDAAGLVSRTERLGFRVVGPKKKRKPGHARR
jgi:hypothetical protein